MDTTQLLVEFSAQTGISGREYSAHAFAKQQLEPYGSVTISPTGSVICTVREPKKAGDTHVLLDAHMDEIGLIVSYIDEDGFLRVAAAGGVDERLLMSSRVQIHTRKGALTGIICSIPPHLSTGEEKNPKATEIYIDTGLTGEQAKEQIAIGDSVTFSALPTPLLGDRVRGKGLDDRAGCIALLKALEYLKGDFDCGLTIVFSSMEEIGLQGATTAAYGVNPTHAIAVDGTFAETPDVKRPGMSLLGEGPCVGFAPILNHAISQRLVSLAQELEIPFQYEVMSGRTGTNADAIATTQAGVKTGLLSFPQRFMHTPSEIVSATDIDNTGRLIAAWIQDLGKGEQ